MSKTVQRMVGVVALVVIGLLSLPVSAALFDGEGTENWIVPAQFVVMAVVGVAMTTALPAMAPDGAAAVRRVMTGLWWGLLAAFVGVLVFWLLLSGFSGA